MRLPRQEITAWRFCGAEGINDLLAGIFYDLAVRRRGGGKQ
jgi:hypothetical protein